MHWRIPKQCQSHISTAKVNESTGNKHFLIELEDAETESVDPENAADDSSKMKDENGKIIHRRWKMEDGKWIDRCPK